MKKVLVTGGAGYIGSHTAKVLAQAGIEPVVLDNLSLGHRWAVKWGRLIEGDTGDYALVRKTLETEGIDAVVHFAAHASVGESVENPRKYFTNNVANTQRLLDAMLDAGVKTIVFSSTCATYGDPERLPLSEDHPQAPVNPYGESKLFVEKILRWYGEAYGLKWAALRYFNAAGADPEGEAGEVHSPETHLIPLVLFAAMGRGPRLRVLGTDYATEDGTAVRDYIHVTDLAAAHLKALEHLKGGGGGLAANLGTGQGYSVRQVIETVERVTGLSVPQEEAPRRAGDPPALVADASMATRLLDWQPQFSSIESIVETAFNFFTAHPELLGPE